MKGSVLKSILPSVLSAVIASAFTQACSVGNSRVSAQTTEAADPIEGLWSSQVTVTNCQTGAVMRSFAALNLFARGGTVIDTDSQPPTGHGPGFGVWTNSGAQYTSSFQFYRFNTDGSLAGSQQIARTITLAPGGQSFTSSLNVSILDTNGNSIGSACGTETATRPLS